MVKGIFLILIASCVHDCSVFAQRVRIVQSDSGWRLMHNNTPLFIRGVVGHSFLEKAKKYGAGSVRIGYDRKGLDEAYELGLTAMVNLPAKAEREGMDYSNPILIAEQKSRIMDIVKSLKKHPAVLMWSIGNELDYIPGNKPYNLKLWDAVNDIAEEIHKEDSEHPVMMVIGTSLINKISDITKSCPALDLLGINTYGDIGNISFVLRQYGWSKPYVFTEWGPKGYWEVKKTPWKVPYEQTGREKYDSYRCFEMPQPGWYCLFHLI